MRPAPNSRVGHVFARAATAAAALIAAGAGCAPVSHFREPRVALPGPAGPGADTTAAALVGDWTGQYDAPFYARRGALRLSLRRVVRVVAGAAVSTVTGTATVVGVSSVTAVVDSAHVARGRVVLWFEPMADQESGATLQLRLDGALAADTLGGRLRADLAATVAPEHHGGWRVFRVVLPARLGRSAS